MQWLINHENKGLLTERGIDEQGVLLKECEDEIEVVGCDAQMTEYQRITWFGSHGGDGELNALFD